MSSLLALANEESEQKLPTRRWLPVHRIRQPLFPLASTDGGEPTLSPRVAWQISTPVLISREPPPWISRGACNSTCSEAPLAERDHHRPATAFTNLGTLEDHGVCRRQVGTRSSSAPASFSRRPVHFLRPHPHTILSPRVEALPELRPRSITKASQLKNMLDALQRTCSFRAAVVVLSFVRRLRSRALRTRTRRCRFRRSKHARQHQPQVLSRQNCSAATTSWQPRQFHRSSPPRSDDDAALFKELLQWPEPVGCI